MICPKCGASAPEGDNFCEECGASLKKKSNTVISNKDNGAVPKSDFVVVDPSLACATNVGRKHPKNEDAGTVMRCDNGSVILVVSDGVSSALNSTTASQLAVEKAVEVLAKGQNGSIDLMRSAINEANDLVIKLPSETREDGIYGPEATIVAAKVTGDNVTIGWVGDSRAYILSPASQKLLTIDDSWIELVVASGEMTRSQAIKDKKAHYVTQVLGMHDQAMEVHLLRCKIEKGQMLLLCSDGLWNYLQGDNDLLYAILNFGMEKDAADICDYLVNLANNAGGHDNITVAILKNM